MQMFLLDRRISLAREVSNEEFLVCLYQTEQVRINRENTIRK